MTADTVLRTTWPSISVGGAPLPVSWQDRIAELRLYTGLRSVGRATLTFADPDYSLATSALLAVGTTVTVKALEPASATLLDGTVTSVESEFTDGWGALLTVTVDDRGVELARAEASATYHEMTYAAVVAQLARESGLSAQVSGLPSTVMPFAMRNDTPLGLVDEVAQRYGCDWVVAGTVLHVWAAATGNVPGATTPTLVAGESLTAFSVRQVGDAPTKVTVRGWDASRREPVVATADSPGARSGRQPTTPSGKVNARTDARAGVSTDDEARHVAAGLAARTGRMIARGRAPFTPTLVAGGSVTIQRTGPGDGTYYVREVTHVIDSSGSRTSFVAGDRDPVRLSDGWAGATSSFRRAGLAVGLVDNLQDPEKLGRVSVSIITASDQAKSAWARVLQPGAGAEHGHLFLPDVGDEVLVGFENDDLARPVVLGGLYGGRAAPHQEVLDSGGKLVAHAIRTRTGHLLELREGAEESAQHVLLKLANGAQLRIGNDTVVLEAPSGKPLTIKAGQSSIAFDGNGKITVKGTTIELASTGAITVDAKSTVGIKGQTGASLEGLTTSVKAQASGTVEASGVLEVKGAMVKIN